jgi:hypothetical protein
MRRPRRITFLCIILLGLSIYNLVGALSVYARWDFLSQLPLTAPPGYLLLRDGLWALILGAIAVALWRLAPWARRAVLIAVTLFLAHGWFDRLALARADFARETWPWTLAFDVFCLVMLAVLLAAYPTTPQESP